MLRSILAIAAFVSTTYAQPAPGSPEPAPAPPGEQPPQPPQLEPPPAQPQPQPQQQPPPGSTRATFVSTSALQWDVVIGDQPACATPCSIVVLPLQYVTLHTHEYRPVQLDVGMLPPGDLMVHAVPLRRGEYAAGVTFVSLGGMALATGITLGAVGYGTGSSGLTTAGWATAIPGAIVLAGSIWLMQHALPHWF